MIEILFGVFFFLIFAVPILCATYVFCREILKDA